MGVSHWTLPADHPALLLSRHPCPPPSWAAPAMAPLGPWAGPCTPPEELQPCRLAGRVSSLQCLRAGGVWVSVWKRVNPSAG